MSLNFFRHGISRTDFNLLSDSELSFMEVISKMPSNPGTAPMNKGRHTCVVDAGTKLIVIFCLD